MKLLSYINYYYSKQLLLLVLALGIGISSMAQSPFTYRYTKHQKEEGYSFQLLEDKITVICGYGWPSSPIFSYPSSFTIDYEKKLLNEDTLDFMDIFYVLPVDESFLLNRGKIGHSLDGVLLNSDTSGYYPNDAIAVVDSLGKFDSIISLAWLWHSDSLYTKGVQRYTDSSLITLVKKDNYSISYFIELDFEGNEIRRCFLERDAIYAFRPMANGDLVLWWFENGNSHIQLINTDCEIRWTRELHNSIVCLGGVEGNSVENITEDSEGNIYLVRTVDSLNIPGNRQPKSVILKLDRTDGSCIWERGISPAHNGALTIGVEYVEKDHSVLFANTYDYIYNPPLEIPLGLGKLDASTGDIIWFRKVDVPELKSIGYEATPRELKTHGENIVTLATIVYETRDSLGNIEKIHRDPMLFYLNCDGFDSLPRANFTGSSESNQNVIFSNTSTHASEFYWDFGDGTTSTDTFPSHTYAAEGFYNVRLIVTSCEYADTISKQIYATKVSVQEFNITDKVLVSPNPTRAYINVAINEFKIGANCNLMLYNNLGALVFSTMIRQEFSRHSLSDLPDGIYHLQVQQNGKLLHHQKMMLMKP